MALTTLITTDKRAMPSDAGGSQGVDKRDGAQQVSGCCVRDVALHRAAVSGAVKQPGWDV